MKMFAASLSQLSKGFWNLVNASADKVASIALMEFTNLNKVPDQ